MSPPAPPLPPLPPVAPGGGGPTSCAVAAPHRGLRLSVALLVGVLAALFDRAMAYRAMTRGRHNNEAFLYQKFGLEADHEHAKPVAAPGIHQTRRGNIPQPTVSARFWATASGPARCTSRPNALRASCFPRWSPR
jgi:hypothetical protein